MSHLTPDSMGNGNRSLTLTDGEKRAFLVSVAAGLVTFLFAMANEIQVPDNISLFMDAPERGVDTHGRWLLRLWGEASLWQPLRPIGWLICIAAYSLAGVVIARLWRVRSVLGIALIGLVLTINPSVAQFSRWDIYRPTVGVAYLLVAMALYLAARGLAWALLGAVLVALSMAIHQSSISFGLTVWAFAIAAATALDTGSDLRAALTRAARQLATVFAGGLLYISSLAFMAQVLGMRLKRVDSDMPSLAQYGEKLETALATLRSFFSSGLTEWPDQLIVGAVAVLGLVLYLSDRRISWRAKTVGTLALLAGCFAVFTHQFAMARTVFSGWTQRAAQGLNLIPLIFFVLALYRLKGATRKLVAAACLLFAGLLSFQSQKELFDSYRVTQRMKHDIQRAMTQVEMSPNYRPGMPVVLAYGYPHGGFHHHPRRSNPYLLNYYGFKTRLPANTKATLTRSQAVAREMPLWPNPGSVRVTPEMAVIAFDTIAARKLRAGDPPVRPVSAEPTLELPMPVPAPQEPAPAPPVN